MKRLSYKRSFLRLLRATTCLCIVSALPCLPASAIPLSYLVTVNPSGLGGTSGYWDMQFNPGALPGTQLAVATASDGQSWLFDVGTGGTIAGDVTGQLPIDSFVTFTNDTSFNDYLQFINFGSSPDSFSLTIDGPAVESPDGTSISGSSFAISFFDNNLNPVLTSNPDGFAAIVNVNLDGTGSVETFPNADGGPPALTITNENAPPPSPIPEPAAMFLVATGLSGIIGLVRRRAHQ